MVNRGKTLIEYINLLGFVALGVSFGYLLGLKSQKGINPTVKSMQAALDVEKEIHQRQLGRLKKQLGEWEQPQELSQMAAKMGGMGTEDMVSMFINQIGGMKNIPGWLRPAIPGITGWIKSNPEQIKQIISKVAGGQSKPGENQEGNQDYL